MNRKEYDDLNFKTIGFQQMVTLERWDNLALSFKTERQMKEIVKEVEEKMHKKCSYREQQIDTEYSGFNQMSSKAKKAQETKKAGRPKEQKHWILEYVR